MREPDLTGSTRLFIGKPEGPAAAPVKAWRSRATPLRPDHEANLAAWVINGPFHPFWSWWVIGLISLRPIEGVKAANKQYPEAEYELLIVSLNPEKPDPDPDEAESLHHLMPPDLAFQFHGVTDEQATEITELLVKAIVEGLMSPDSDHRGYNTEKLETTVAHFREGRHG